MKNKNTLSFFFGIVSGALIVPILQEITNVALTWFEVVKIQPTKIIAEYNKQVMDGDEVVGDSYMIGFQAPSHDDEYYDDEEEE